MEVGGDRITGQLKLLLTEQQRKDRFDLEDCERVAQTLVTTAAKGNVREVTFVFFSWWRKAIRIERFGVWEDVWNCLLYTSRCV